MEQITALDFKIKEMAARIRELREIQNLTTAQMAEKTGVSESVFTDSTFRIDTQGYLLDDLPNAIVGRKYPLLQGEAYDVTGRKLAILKKIYYESHIIKK